MLEIYNLFSFDRGLAFALSLVGDVRSIARTVETSEEVTDFGDGQIHNFMSPHWAVLETMGLGPVRGSRSLGMCVSKVYIVCATSSVPLSGLCYSILATMMATTITDPH